MATQRTKRLPDLAQDRPIDRVADDRLDRIPFVESLIRALVRDEVDLRGRLVARRSTGIVVGLVGPWGSGKSSILNMVDERLNGTEHVAVATLNPWLFRGRDELVAAFFNELKDALGRSPLEKVRELATALETYRGTISTVAGHVGTVADAMGAHGAGAIGAEAIKKGVSLVKKPRDLSPQEERRSLEKKLLEAKVAVVVLVDELDRVEDDEVRAVAQLIKAIGDIKGISYLVAYDQARVADALGRGEQPERRRIGEAYLEKIIQHPVPVRPLFSHDVTAFLDALLHHHGVQLPADLSEEEMKVVDYIRQTAETPRELKRLVGSYAVLGLMLRNEVSPADLLGYCWLLTKAPSLRDAIAKHIDVMVDDPNADEISRRVIRQMDKKTIDLSEALGADIAPHDKLLGLLFPRFGTGRNNDSADRISRRRNLVRALYLGDPPGIASGDDARKLWDEPDEGILCAELGRLLKSGELRPIIDRLDDMLPKLPAKGDAKFWRALAKSLVRDKNWYLAPEENHAIGEDATTYLLRLGKRDKTKVERVKAVAEALLQAGDLVILPELLRKHLFHWGLTVHQRAPGTGDFIFNKKETEDLLDKTTPIFRAALLDGTLLRRILNCEAIFALSNSGRWDDELRKSLTGDLSAPEGRASIAALIVPPGYSASRDSLDALFDADAIFALMKAGNEGTTAAPWIEECRRRLRLILAGKDPMFLSYGEDGDEDELPAITT